MLCLCALCTVWFGFLCVSDFYHPYPPTSTQQGISFSTLGPLTTNSILMPCCSPSSLTSPILFAQTLFHRPHVLHPASSLSHFPHRRGSPPDPVSVFSDGNELSRRDVTERLRTMVASAGVDGNSFRKSTFWIGLATSGSAAADL